MVATGLARGKPSAIARIVLPRPAMATGASAIVGTSASRAARRRSGREEIAASGRSIQFALRGARRPQADLEGQETGAY